MGWPKGPTLAPSADGYIAVASGFHPRFAESLAEHLEVALLDDDGWQKRVGKALSRWASAQGAESPSVEFMGSGRARISYSQETPPPGWRWVDEGVLELTDDGRRALAKAQAAEAVTVYVGTGRLPEGWSPPADCPGFIVRPLSAPDVRVVDAQVGSEPPRPSVPEWRCDLDSPDGRAWRNWRRWRLRRDAMYAELAWKAALRGGEQLEPEAFLDELHRSGQVDLAAQLFAEAAQHIYRLTYIPVSLGKGSGGRSGCARGMAGDAQPTTAARASGPVSGA